METGDSFKSDKRFYSYLTRITETAKHIGEVGRVFFLPPFSSEHLRFGGKFWSHEEINSVMKCDPRSSGNVVHHKGFSVTRGKKKGRKIFGQHSRTLENRSDKNQNRRGRGTKNEPQCGGKNVTSARVKHGGRGGCRRMGQRWERGRKGTDRVLKA